MKFVNFVGNERVKEQLTYLQESGRLPHAFVIEGEEGLGKRTLAKEIFVKPMKSRALIVLSALRY